MIITVTAGHGATDPGAIARSGETEAALMTELRDILAHKLRLARHTVRTDGARGENLPLTQAIKLVPGSDLAIELHTNSFTNPAAKGVEVISPPAKRPQAQRLAAAISRVLEIPLRGEQGWIDQSKTARGRLGFVVAGGLVVEVFFLSNPEELAKYQARKWLVASALAEAIGVPA